MVAEGRVSEDLVEYNDLPWKYSAGTPNILGVIASAQALRFAVDLMDVSGRSLYFRSTRPVAGLGCRCHHGLDRRTHQPADLPCAATAARTCRG